MKKIKLLKIFLPNSLEETYSKILNNPFKIGAPNGFEPIKFSESYACAKFIEEVISKELITDPFGNTEEVTSKRYIINEFTISRIRNNHILILENPSRSVRELIRKLSEILGTSFYASAIQIDIHALSEFLSNNRNSIHFKNTRALLSGVNLDEGSSATIEITSLKDAINDAKYHFKGKTFKIERARFTASSGTKKSTIEVRSTGLISVHGPDEKSLVELINMFIAEGLS